jgi:hypothetical protein
MISCLAIKVNFFSCMEQKGKICYSTLLQKALSNDRAKQTVSFKIKEIEREKTHDFDDPLIDYLDCAFDWRLADMAFRA